jgi:Holliday junction resolvase RusA-like endonuclease
MTWAIAVPRVADSPNVLRRKYRHPQAYRRLRLAWQSDLFWLAGAVQGRKICLAAQDGRKMRVLITVYHGKPFDADNLAGAQKPILDALVQIGFLKNDDAKSLQLDEPKQVIGKERQTIVEIEAL